VSTQSATGSGAAVDTGAWGYFRFFLFSLKKRFILLVRYPVNTLTDRDHRARLPRHLLRGRAVAPAAISDTLGGIIVGYLLWSMSISAYMGLAWNATRESQWGPSNSCSCRRSASGA